MRQLFIYYRLRTDDAGAAEQAVHAFQAALRAQFPSLATRLLRRPEAVDGVSTWMETYATDPLRDPDEGPGGVTAAMQAAIEERATALRPWLLGARHTEEFIACVS